MKSSTLRIVVVLATLSIIGITITQVYWVRKAFDLQRSDFERQVNTALLSVAQQFFTLQNTPPPANNPVQQLSTNYFVVMLNSDINPSMLEFLLRTEFEKRNIETDFEYGIYDCSQECMVYGMVAPTGLVKTEPKLDALPKLKNASYYFGVRFPGRELQLINQMGIWTFSSLVLLVVIIFFAYALFVILRQRRLSEIQKDFINNMTHEFKTPLSTIALSAEVLREQARQNNEPRLLNYTNIIDQETDRMRQHLERLLQVAKLDKTDMQLNCEQLDVHELLQTVLTGMQPQFNDRDVTVSVAFTATKTKIKADLHHITNVFINVFDNAMKYTETKPLIKVSTRQHGNFILIQVTDNGIGIAPEYQTKIFHKFFRVPTGNVHNVKGFGLGLSYVKQVVDAHKGKVSVSSQLNEGTTLSISLPTLE
ncbi:MAG: sensor histidine kinase [Cytophagia bacterium]|nr:sensor histidine kinase [Cytophagia bacterium]